MKKTMLMGLGLAFSLAGVAAAQQGGQRAPRAEHGQRQAGRAGPGAGMRALFRNITLTDAQKDQLKQLRKSDQAKMEARRDDMKKQREDVRAARAKGDTAAVRALMLRNRQAMEQARTQQVAQLRAVLTAEQQVQFDKNVSEMKQRMEQRSARRGQRGPGAGRGARSGH